MEIIIEWVLGNPYLSLAIGIAIAEFVTRLTPTEKDDGFIQRFGGVVKIILDAVKVPNVVKKVDIEL